MGVDLITIGVWPSGGRLMPLVALPEPATLALLGIGLIAIGLLYVRGRRKPGR